MKRTTLLFFAFLGLLFSALPAKGGPEESETGERPRLVLVITVDQMRGDDLERFEATLSPDGGFAHLQKQGLRFRNCTYAHLATSTGPGHATILTGTNGNRNGIVGNSWYDRESGRQHYCVFGDGPAGRGLGSFEGETLADRLEAATGGDSRTISVAWKDRAALFLGGRRADRIFWFHGKSEGYVTMGTAKEPPAYLSAVNTLPPLYEGRSWKLLLRPDRYPERDDRPYEYGPVGLGRTFPHPIEDSTRRNHTSALKMTPHGDAISLALAKRVCLEEDLGRDETPDLLAISLSACDYVGHWFGPHSRERRDLMARLDQQLGQFLRFIDERVGLDRTLIALTSDHGITPIVEYQAEQGVEKTGRIDLREVYRAAGGAIKKAVEDGVLAEAPESPWVPAVNPPHIYLAEKARTPEVRARVARAVAAIPGIGGALSEDAARADTSEMARRARLCLYPGRSGDVLFWLDGRHTWKGWEAATHGRPNRDDSHVPLILVGPGIQPGERTEACHVRDLAPTLADLLDLSLPKATGRVLPTGP